MADDPRVQELLDSLLETRASPEAVCDSCPELLPQVRERWRQICNARDELDALFPPAAEPGTTLPRRPGGGAPLPVIPGYEVEAVLGYGGMGVVFRARHLRLNRVVALKMALAGAYAGPRERERFQREAEAVAVLKHPNVVQIYDVGDSDSRSYFTMEYVEGGSLAQKLSGAPLPGRQAAELLATVTRAVQAAHDGGVVHRDLKPANVLLTLDGVPKVSDFGLARRLNSEAALTRTGTAIGTPSYMAPEQARGEGDGVGSPADVYALGAILYELLTGRPPFRAETVAETVNQVLAQDPVPPSRLNGKVPRDLETICLKCLQKEPQFRYATAAALADDLECFLHGEGIAARPEGRLSRLLRKVSRRPVLSAAVAVALVSTVALVGGGLWVLSERAATARALQAEVTATERAAAEDLQEMLQGMQQSSWLEARAALDRAKVRLGEKGSADLRRRMDRGNRDLELVARLDAIRLHRTATIGGYLDFPRSTEEYQTEFRNAGIGEVHENPEVVADRVKASNIQAALVATLDDWSVWTPDPHRKDLALAVARAADSEPMGWRNQARDLVKQNKMVDLAKFLEMTNVAQLADQPVSLLLSLEHRLYLAQYDTISFASKLQQAHSGDFWSNLLLGQRLFHKKKHSEALRYSQAALALRPETHIAQHEVGIALHGSGRHADAVEHFRKALQIDPTARATNYGLALSLQGLGQHNEAIENFQLLLGTKLDSAFIRSSLGDSLGAVGRSDAAIEEFRRALSLDPKLTRAQKGLRDILLQQGQTEEARSAWKAAIDANPSEHDAWSGYAELCLFLGQEDEYRRSCSLLLDKFEGSTNPRVCEVVGRACLLLPPSESNLQLATALIDRALATDPDRRGWYRYFEAAKGLAEYRAGHLEAAIKIMEGEAAKALGPMPKLVVSMARFRLGQSADARRTLDQAILLFDWSPRNAKSADAWMYHVLRREAEGMILTSLREFSEGTKQPQDDN